ncbi:MAG: hypothetical protein M3063_16280 [Actinomycetota bacterium]|nr:hypothetical protein [Actinomycetota bacterium]
MGGWVDEGGDSEMVDPAVDPGGEPGETFAVASVLHGPVVPIADVTGDVVGNRRSGVEAAEVGPGWHRGDEPASEAVTFGDEGGEGGDRDSVGGQGLCSADPEGGADVVDQPDPRAAH